MVLFKQFEVFNGSKIEFFARVRNSFFRFDSQWSKIGFWENEKVLTIFIIWQLTDGDVIERTTKHFCEKIFNELTDFVALIAWHESGEAFGIWKWIKIGWNWKKIGKFIRVSGENLIKISIDSKWSFQQKTEKSDIKATKKNWKLPPQKSIKTSTSPNLYLHLPSTFKIFSFFTSTFPSSPSFIWFSCRNSHSPARCWITLKIQMFY